MYLLRVECLFYLFKHISDIIQNQTKQVLPITFLNSFNRF